MGKIYFLIIILLINTSVQSALENFSLDIVSKQVSSYPSKNFITSEGGKGKGIETKERTEKVWELLFSNEHINRYLSLCDKYRLFSCNKTCEQRYWKNLKRGNKKSYKLTKSKIGKIEFIRERFAIYDTYGSFDQFNIQNHLTDSTKREDFFNNDYYQCNKFLNSIIFKNNQPFCSFLNDNFSVEKRKGIPIMEDEPSTSLPEFYCLVIKNNDLKIFPLAALKKLTKRIKESKIYLEFHIENTLIDHLNDAILDLCAASQSFLSRTFNQIKICSPNITLDFSNNKIFQIPRRLLDCRDPKFVFNALKSFSVKDVINYREKIDTLDPTFNYEPLNNLHVELIFQGNPIQLPDSIKNINLENMPTFDTDALEAPPEEHLGLIQSNLNNFFGDGTDNGQFRFYEYFEKVCKKYEKNPKYILMCLSTYDIGYASYFIASVLEPLKKENVDNRLNSLKRKNDSDFESH